ncbi:hypothetical protein [Streptomyces albogriseolus]|uniref:hypothetical protein n=1 Tax=Streptomyces albogriseolus TaxID=1887 RepID=UPI0033B09DED
MQRPALPGAAVSGGRVTDTPAAFSSPATPVRSSSCSPCTARSGSAGAPGSQSPTGTRATCAPFRSCSRTSPQASGVHGRVGEHRAGDTSVPGRDPAGTAAGAQHERAVRRGQP